MASTSETGHAKNVANLEDLISFCTGFGATYNPSKTELQIPKLKALLSTAQLALNETTSSENAFNNATNSRMNAFKPLKSLGTRLVNALDATDASDATVKDAKTINKKLQGQRATPKPIADPTGTNPGDKSISTSQQSYDQQIEHFSKLVDLLSSDSNYAPNETELKVPALKAGLTG